MCMYIWVSWVEGFKDGDTELNTSGSMVSTSSSILQVSDFHKASSFSLLKGKAEFSQIHSMWSAFWETTLPCWSNETRIVIFAKCHTSLMYLMTAGSMIHGSSTVYHGIIDCRCLNLAVFFSFVNLSRIGSHITSYWASAGLRDFSVMWLRIKISSSEMSRSDISSNTCFLFSTSILACLAKRILSQNLSLIR